MIRHIPETPIALVVILGGCLISGSASAEVDEVTLGASSVWSNWYWPSQDSLNPNMYDEGECMARYDAYDIPSGESAQEWEASPYNHGDFPDVLPYHGHCHAWSAAAIWEPQPDFSETHSGVEFRIRDKKALITELYTRAREEDNIQFREEYPSPGTLWRILRQEIGGINPTAALALKNQRTGWIHSTRDCGLPLSTGAQRLSRKRARLSCHEPVGHARRKYPWQRTGIVRGLPRTREVTRIGIAQFGIGPDDNPVLLTRTVDGEVVRWAETKCERQLPDCLVVDSWSCPQLGEPRSGVPNELSSDVDLEMFSISPVMCSPLKQKKKKL